MKACRSAMRSALSWMFGADVLCFVVDGVDGVVARFLVGRYYVVC